MQRVIHDGPEDGIYSAPNFLFMINNYDPDRVIEENEMSSEAIRYVAQLRRFDVKLTYEGKMKERAKVTLEGEEDAVERCARFFSGENKALLEAVAKA